LKVRATLTGVPVSIAANCHVDLPNSRNHPKEFQMIRKAWMLTVFLLVSLVTLRLTAQEQYGPPASGNTSAILFAPATLNLVAGLNGAGYGGDGGPANSATTMLNSPIGIAYDSNGNLFIADSGNHVVRRIDHGTGDISTFAGQQASPGFSIGGGVATSAQMQAPSGLVVDSNNNVYVADRFNAVVFKITPAGVISIFAGSGTTGYGGDGGSATAPAAEFNNPWALGIDSSNNIYIADTANNLIRKVTQAGNLSTFAGDNADVSGCNASEYSTGAPPYTALQAHLCFPQGIAFDTAGNAYITDTKNDVIYKVDNSGNLTLFAGTFRTSGFSGDNGPATSAWFNEPAGLYADPAGRVYISDFFNGRIRVVDTLGNINTVFGDGFGSLNSSSIGEPDTEAVSVTFGPANGIYDFVLDQEGRIIATDSSSPAVTSAGSTGQYVFPETNVFNPSVVKYITVENPSGVALDFMGTPSITGPYSLATGGSAGTCNFSGTLPAGETCTIGVIFTPIVDDAHNPGSLTLTTNANSSPSTISLSGMSDGTGTTLANLVGPGSSFTAPVGQTSAPEQATLTNDGQEPITISSTSFGGANPTVFAVSSTTCPTSPATLASGASCVFNLTFTPTNTTTASAAFNVNIANYGQLGVPIDGVGTAAAAPVASLTPATVPFGNVTSGTTSAAMQLKLSNTGNATLNITGISIVGANPSDFAVATGANACGASLALDATCFIYVTFTPGSASSFTATLQVADNAAGSPQTSALSGSGTAAQIGQLQFTPSLLSLFAGNGQCRVSNPVTAGAAIDAPICAAVATVTDSKGNEYILDQDYNSVFKVDTSGNLTVYAGVPTIGNGSYGGDNGPAASALLASPIDIVVDSSDNLYISDYGNSRIRKVNAVTGVITTFAGFGKLGFFSPGTTATAVLGGPQGMTFDPSGNLYVSNGFGMLVLKIDTSNNVTLFAGQQVTSGGSAGEGIAGYTGDNGPAVNATLSDPNGLASDQQGNIYIADTNNWVVRKVDTSGTITTYAGNHTQGDSGDNGAATSAEINAYGVSTDLAGDLYITGGIGCFGGNNCANIVREVNTSGTISTYAGGGAGTFPGPATGVALTTPYFARIDNNGDLIIPTGETVESAGPQGVLQFGMEDVGFTSGPLTLTLTNTGDGTLAFAGVPGASDAADAFCDGSCLITGDFAVLGGTCNFTNLTPGASCTLTVTFTPSQTGSRAGVLTLATFTSNGESTVMETVQLSGTGAAVAAPSATLTPSLAFPSTTAATTSSALAATLSNTGNATLNITGITIAGTNPTDFALTTGANACGATLAASSSCSIYITFTPATATSFSATLQVADNASGSPQTSALTGTGTAVVAPVATLSPNPVAFGGQVYNTTSPAQAVTLSNTGNATLTGIVATLTGTNPGDFAILNNGTNACGSTLAAGSSCSIWIAFTPVDAGNLQATLSVADNASPSPQTVSLTGTYDYFYSNVGTALAAQPVSVYIATAGTASTINVLTQGAANLDFTMAPGGSCATGTAYTLGEICTVNVIFNPQYAGTRLGAIVLEDASSNVLGTALLPGTGSGPQVVFNPGKMQTGILAPVNTYGASGVAVDAGGNVYFTTSNSNGVYKTPWNGTSYGTPVALGSGWSGPVGVAVDGAGDVFVGDYGNERLVEIPWIGTAYGTQVVVPTTGITVQPKQVAVDGFGNVYFANYVGSTVVEVPRTATGFGSPVTLSFSGLNSPNGVAVDSSGNVYVADTFNDQVLKLPLTPTGFGTQVTVATGLPRPVGVAVDAAGDIYAATQEIGFTSNPLNWSVLEMTLQEGSYGSPLSLFTGLGAPQDVAIDGIGNLYEADFSEDQVNKLDRADSPSLSFASTNVGSTSSDSPQTVTVLNIGNGDLTIQSASYPTNFVENSSDTTLCNADDGIGGGASCDVSVSFIPTGSGSLAGAVVLTDNNLNNNGATQMIQVSGTGVGVAAPVATLTPATVPFGSVTTGTTSAPMLVKLSNTGNAPMNITGISIVGADASDFNLVMGGDACGSTLAAGANCYIVVTFTPGSAATFTATLQVTDNSSGSPQTSTLTGTGTAPPAPAVTLAPNPVVFASQTIGTTSAATTVTLTNSGNATLTITGITITGTNPTDFATTTGSNPCGSTLAAGASCNIYVTFTPASAASFSATLSLADNATGSPQTVALSGSGINPADFTVSATPGSQSVAPGGSTTFSVTVTSVGGTFTNPVALTVSGLPAGATGNFSPSSVTPGSEGGASTLTVQTSTTTPQTARNSAWPLAAPVLAAVGLFFVPGRRRRRWITLAMLLLASLGTLTALSGCSGGFRFIQPLQAYTLTITGTSGNDTHSTTVQLTVE